MKLVVGLGNPGEVYAHTRHNIGASVLESLAQETGTALKKDRSQLYKFGLWKAGQEEAIFAIPLTFMNLSGQAVCSLAKRYRIKPEDILVICDDLDLEFGRIRLKPKGSSAGHKGVASIIEALGTQEFPRLRLGIGRPAAKGKAADFVLSKFNKQEAKELDKIIQQAVVYCQLWLKNGIAQCMNISNKRRMQKNEKI